MEAEVSNRWITNQTFHQLSYRLIEAFFSLDFIGRELISGNVFYTLSNIKTTAKEARRLCSSIDGKLAELTNDEVQEKLWLKLIEEYVGPGTFYCTYFVNRYITLACYHDWTGLIVSRVKPMGDPQYFVEKFFFLKQNSQEVPMHSRIGSGCSVKYGQLINSKYNSEKIKNKINKKTNKLLL